MSTPDTNKRHHFCFAYHGPPRMHFDVFPTLHFSTVEGCDDDEANVRLVRVSLLKNNGRRGMNIVNIVDEYNAHVAASRKDEAAIVPVAYGEGGEIIRCFKISAPLANIAILAKIDKARIQGEASYWKWIAPTGNDPAAASSTVPMKDILASMHLPPSRVTAARAVKELSEKYSLEYGGAVLGKAVPTARKQFVVAEIRKRFCEDFHYVQQPSIGHKLPAEVQSTLADLLGTETPPSLVAAGGGGSGLRQKRKKYVRVDSVDCDPVVDFLAHHALLWNDTGFESAEEQLVHLHASWPGNGSAAVKRLRESCLRRFGLQTKGEYLHVPNVGDLLFRLSQHGVVTEQHAVEEGESTRRRVAASANPENHLLSREIVAFMLRLVDGAGPDVTTVEVTGRDVLIGLNRGPVGAYRMSSVPFFIAPFVDAGVVVCRSHQRYLVYVQKIQSFIDGSEIDKK